MDLMSCDPWTRERLAAFGTEFMPVAPGLTPLNVVDAILKRPASLTYEIVNGSRGRAMAVMAVLAALCMLAYGFIMGTFTGGDQLWAVPVKTMIGSMLAALICLPSLYIISSLAGARQSFVETCGLFLQSLALSGILMVGFMPIAWIFSQSTDTVAFMGGMHVVFWIAATAFGLQLLTRALHFVNKRRMDVLNVWAVVFMVVSLQMCTVMRPLIGAYEKGWVREKKFFLAHWGECLTNKDDQIKKDTHE